MKTICSSIHTSITKLHLCVSLLAIFLYSFIYVQPWQHNHVDIVTINPTRIIMQSTIINQVHEENCISIELVDDLSMPPRHAKPEKRIAWLKPRLKNSKILQSTVKTRQFHDKIMRFISQDSDNNDTKCKVVFFMTWISPNKKLFAKRDLLSLESVFKAHPRGCMVILSKSMDSEPGWRLLEPLVSQGYRVLAVAPDFQLIFSNTPAEVWIKRLEAGLIDPGTIPITQNLSDLLRLVALYKYGGVYIDADVVILKDVSSLRNSIGIQTMENKSRNQGTTLNNAVLIFDKGHLMLLKFIEEFVNTFNGRRWGFNGPSLVTRVIYRRNRDKRIKVNVLPLTAFYPVNWRQIVDYFKKPILKNETNWAQEQLNRVNNKSYGIHLWNKVSRNLTIEEGSIIGKLILDHCIICQDIFIS
ncbi:hypothetical protein RND81_06G157500 [Saponaria officinalis]|uniref:Alpha 1,4-glycosyltransferase domain-containing protein n=1 Tax=Saponaria officinalis TaxID=3572 RepID=A0AAW1KB70_SAPOF